MSDSFETFTAISQYQVSFYRASRSDTFILTRIADPFFFFKRSDPGQLHPDPPPPTLPWFFPIIYFLYRLLYRKKIIFGRNLVNSRSGIFVTVGSGSVFFLDGRIQFLTVGSGSVSTPSGSVTILETYVYLHQWCAVADYIHAHDDIATDNEKKTDGNNIVIFKTRDIFDFYLHRMSRIHFGYF